MWIRLNSGPLDQRLYAAQDANHNVTALIDTSTAVVERYEYDPYGKATVLDANWAADSDGVSDVGSIYLYQNLRLNPVTGLYHADNREYDPDLGRWNRPDPHPAGPYVQGMNPFQFVGSNPIVNTDPTGLQSLGSKFTEVLIWRITRRLNPAGAVLNWIGNDLYWFDDDENEMTSLVSAPMSSYYRDFANRHASEITKEWKEFTIYRESAQSRVGGFNTGSGSTLSTRWYLGGAHDVYASGTLKLRCDGKNIRMKDLNVKWEWYDQIDANSFIQGKNNGSGTFKWIVEGLWDLGPEKIGAVDYHIWVTWYDKRYSDKPDGVSIAAMSNASASSSTAPSQ